MALPGRMTIGIAGAGGIGSNVARHLAQARVPKICVVDFDRVEWSNLNRQFYCADQVGRPKVACLKHNLLGIHPDMEIKAVTHCLGPGDGPRIFRDCAVVVEGLDSPAAKKQLIEDLSGTRTPVVAASGIAGYDLEGIRTRRIGHCHIVGDFSTDTAAAPLFPPKVAVISAMMAALVLDAYMKLCGNSPLTFNR